MSLLFRRPVVAIALLSCLVSPALAQERPPATVTVVTVEPETVTLTSTLPGRVAASAQAEVRPQVNGIITERLFEEGAQVELDRVEGEIAPVEPKRSKT